MSGNHAPKIGEGLAVQVKKQHKKNSSIILHTRPEEDSDENDTDHVFPPYKPAKEAKDNKPPSSRNKSYVGERRKLEQSSFVY